MTFIIGGKTKNSTFLMVDAIATDVANNKETLQQKLYKLKSSENTYFCITGPKFFSDSLIFLDNWCELKNEETDFIINNNDVDNLKQIIAKFAIEIGNTEEKKCDFFFINKQDIYCLKLVIYENNKVNNFGSPFKINQDNFFERPSLDIQQNLIAEEKSMYSFCEKQIKSLANGKDLKNRLSFIEFKDDNENFKSSLKSCSDYFSMIFNKQFSEIDIKKWEL
jgi:hypothetical protein